MTQQSVRDRFADNLDEEEETRWTQDGNCRCGQSITVNERTESASGCDPVSTNPNSDSISYPPYLRVSRCGDILVKGSTSRLVMRMHEQHASPPKIAKTLVKLYPTERYNAGEIQSIIHTCSALELEGYSPAVADAWDNEPIEGWWMKEDGYCERLARAEPIDEDDSGYDCTNGWWKHRESAKERDWSIWGPREIGPEAWRREQARRYDLYGSEGVQMKWSGANGLNDSD